MVQWLALATSLALPSIRAKRVRAFVEGPGGCNTLTNKGSFSTVEVLVGTPPQRMNIVADTGSDLTLVESCTCQDSGSCSKDGHCFRGGQGKSSTFSLDKDPEQITITYGSGDIDTMVASDTVRMGNVRVQMDHSLMLITKNRLKGHLQLEGILGLGLPQGAATMSEQKGFLDQAKMSRFAMCFNDGGKDGLLRLGSHVRMDKPLLGIGQQHWSLDFRGVSVGSASVEGGTSMFCSSMEQHGQETPCGAIVDSGTTLILAPQQHLTQLLAQICDGWPKCKDKSEAMLLSLPADHAGDASLLAKAKALHHSAADCSLEGMPPIHFHVRGRDGTQDTLELSPNDYMIETKMETKFLQFLGLSAPTKRCSPAFESSTFQAGKNGPVWLLGTPFFYKYNVAYDRSTTPPSISFNRNGCGSCSSPLSASLLSQRASARRHLDTEPRVSFINTTRPL